MDSKQAQVDSSSHAGEMSADGARALSATQADLYAAMKSGVTVFYMGYMGRLNPNAYYFRGDTMKRCTAAAEALKKKGLAKDVGKYRDVKLVLTGSAA